MAIRAPDGANKKDIVEISEEKIPFGDGTFVEQADACEDNGDDNYYDHNNAKEDKDN